ncbi:MAG: hypothetical protein GMKNLPBB_02654 [Myxococcota bacterium]|nr:hypothetical protein [Myxococcota bacterium]
MRMWRAKSAALLLLLAGCGGDAGKADPHTPGSPDSAGEAGTQLAESGVDGASPAGEGPRDSGEADQPAAPTDGSASEVDGPEDGGGDDIISPPDVIQPDAAPADATPGDSNPAECKDPFLRRPALEVDLEKKASVAVKLPPCSQAHYYPAEAKGASVNILWNGSPARVVVQQLDGTIIADRNSTPDETLRINMMATRPGEFRVAVISTEGVDGSLSVNCVDGCSNSYTRHPVVLVHGFSGFENIGPVDYFWKLKDEFGGVYDIFTPQQDAFNSIQERAKQLREQLEGYRKRLGYRKFNLIGHSMGGLDCRALASQLNYATYISSISTYATPHQGTKVADAVLGLIPGETGKDILGTMLNLFGVALGGSREQDAKAALSQLTTKYLRETFNPATPDAPGVKYFSITGKTCAGLGCPHDVIRVLRPTYELLKRLEGDNDGLVSVTSSEWGESLGVHQADHMAEVGHLFGATGPYKHLAWFQNHFFILRSRGH